MRVLLKRATLVGTLVVILILAACGGGSTTIPPTTTATTSTGLPATTTAPPTTTITTSTPPATTTAPTATVAPEDLLPPSAEELAAQGFVLPDLARITCERLKQMMDNSEPFLLVDTRISFLFNFGNLPQSITVPIDLPERDFTDRLMILPKVKPVILYCG